MAVETFHFRPTCARRIPDPNFKNTHGLERHLFMMSVKEMPSGIGLDPNARSPNIRKRVYQQVEASLLGLDGSPPGTFHLKNKGITIIADSVKQVGKDEYSVGLRSGLHGIVDGGHTYELIVRNTDNEDLPDDQYVSVEIRVGIPDFWIPEIAGGLNTSVQVQAMSLDNLAGAFSWLKEDLKPEPYFSEIAWSENDKGEFDARDIISLMLLFNVALFPNDRDDHPVIGYEKKSLALKMFEDSSDSFKRMRPILKDLLQFHDIVRQEARHLWNQAGGKGGSLSFIEHRRRGTFLFPFSRKKDEYRLMTGALYPILAAFRWYVEQDPTTLKFGWRGGFPAILAAWRGLGAELMRATVATSNELGRNPQSIGKSRNHWANLHARVIKYDLMSQQAKSA